MNFEQEIEKQPNKKAAVIFEKYRYSILNAIENGYSQIAICKTLIKLNGGTKKGLSQQNLSRWLKRQRSKQDPAANKKIKHESKPVEVNKTKEKEEPQEEIKQPPAQKKPKKNKMLEFLENSKRITEKDSK